MDVDTNSTEEPSVESTQKATGKKSWLKIPKISFKNMNRNTVLAVLLTGVLLIVGIVTFILTRNNGSEVATDESVNTEQLSQETKVATTVKQIDGTLQIKATDGEWQDATTEDAIEEGQSIRTVGATSRAVLLIDGATELRLDANSEVELETLRADRIVIKHVAGYTYSRVVSIEGRTYSITSKDAKYEAKGTAFKTTATGDEQSVEVYENAVIETNLNESAKTGQKLTVINKQSPSSDGKIEPLDIEKVKNDPFMQWNRELDAKDDKFKDLLGFLKDVTAPEITLITEDGDVIFLDPNATEGTIEISGKTESGVKVTVLSKSQAGAQPVEVTVSESGEFTTPVLSAPLGNSVFEFIAKDKTGNTTTKTLRVTFQRKSQPVTGSTSSIKLSAATLDGGAKVQLSWTYGSDTSAPDGVKVIYSKDETPIFNQAGTTTAGYYKTEKEATFKFSDLGMNTGETYYFKVCAYDKASGTCGLHSTVAEVKVP